MGISTVDTDTVREIRLPAGGSYIITDEVGTELFRVTAVADAVKVAGVAISGASAAKLAAATGAAVASGTATAHIADLATNATGTAIATAVNALIDTVEAFSMSAAV